MYYRRRYGVTSPRWWPARVGKLLCHLNHLWRCLCVLNITSGRRGTARLKWRNLTFPLLVFGPIAQAIQVYRLVMSVRLSVNILVQVSGWNKILGIKRGISLKLNLSGLLPVTCSIDLYGNFDLDLGIVDFQGQIVTILPCRLKPFLSTVLGINSKWILPETVSD